MTLREQVGLRVREHRRAAGLSQQDLAEMIGKSTQAISEIERGSIAPSLNTLEAISTALATPPSRFFPDTFATKRQTRKDKILIAITAAAAHLNNADAEILLTLANELAARNTGR